ncbi:protein ENHANCED DOWNY MILDEW 2 isoform X2 [Benincasa hispida]|uniref:protein ENHANCED DOWNY MILDEW 2 isoform X2 n=1 Tax=Benincasa hispida TaxID=102211 RepID=UPI001902700C|nr:protein ENHANCED DOWNY MILDEW 2 isoform X2 [Benincasa hispida]
MGSSDDEAENLPLSVSNYHFVDHMDEPISFSILPIQWDEGERLEGSQEPVFLHGTADGGLQKVYKQVTAWRFNICGSKPEISVLSKENVWIKLQKPRKSFEDTIRAILITVQCLHALKRNPDTSSKSLWDLLARIFSSYEVRPSQNDLVDHMPLISEAVNRDDILAKSQLLLAFLEEKPVKRTSSLEDGQRNVQPSFIVDDSDDEDMVDDAVEEESDDDVFDSVCAFCDNGGNIICCDGRCMRSFHATPENGDCFSLGLSREEVDAIETFICKNCEYKQHQCYACGNLGSSDQSSGAEVFQCVNATCGYFYHPKCISKLLHRENKVAAGELEKKIASGESFSCPVHKCSVCKLGENKKVWELQFAVCRRCPKSYHRKCLPRMITFEDSEDGETPTRAWEKLLPNRILIYCLDHEIDEEIETPARDHIKFPGLEESRIHIQKKKLPTGDTTQGKTIGFRRIGENVASKKESMSDDLQGKSAAKVSKSFERSSFDGKVVGKMAEKSLLGSESRKVKLGNVSRKSFNQNGEAVLMDIDKTIKLKKSSLVGKAAMPTKRPDQNKAPKEDRSELGKFDASKPLTKRLNSGMYLLDADSERRLMDLMKNVSSSITLEDVIRKHKVPSTHAYSLKNVVDKTIKMGKLEGSVVAVRAALLKLEEGCCIEDAEAVCEPEVLNHIFKWKNKLKVYLAPFLYGMRYSSFGRHFTKVEKLVEIVDRLHWYIEKGDTIVDFCCGANDFSVLMKKKLDEIGKRCSYRNFDFIPPKNDFNFEKRDWMTVQPKELPKGSQLIMGLNPPFGVKAALANKFIDKALEFNPKLLILIVPPETERLDRKKTPYDLVWEDNEFLSGKSFYLPGSVNAKDKQMDQWNVRPPVLYLWSRRDWTDKHTAIAREHEHLSPRKQEESEKGKTADTSRVKQPEESEKGKSSDLSRLRQQEDSGMGKGSDVPRPKQLESEKGQSSKTSADDIHLHETFLMKESTILAADEPEDSKSGSIVSEVHKNGSTKTSKRDSDRESHDSRDVRPNLSPEAPRKKRQRFEEIPRRGDGETSEESRRDGKRPLNEINQRPHASPNVSDHISYKSVERPSYADAGGIERQQSGLTMPDPNTNFGAPYDAQTSLTDDIARKYNLNAEESFSIGTTGWSNNASPIYDIGSRHIEEQRNVDQMGGHVDGLNYKPYATGVGTYMRDSEIRPHIRHYGHPDTDNLRSNYQTGPDPRYSRIGAFPSTYGHLSTFPEPSHWMNTSATQRYAPRLDELNHTRLGGMGAGHQMNGSSTFDPRERLSSGFRGAPQGFAPGPQYPYSNQNSAGWLNE